MKKLILSVLVLFIPFLSMAQNATWQVLPNAPIGGQWNHDDIACINEDTLWICDLDGRINKSTDGGDSWTRITNWPNTAFRCIDFFDSQHGFVGNLGRGGWYNASDGNPLYETFDGGANWSAVTLPNTYDIKGLCGMQIVNDTTIIAVGRYAGPDVMIKSTDKGVTWTSYASPAESFVDLHFFDPDTGIVVGGFGGWYTNGNPLSRIYYTTDGGESFTQVAAEQSDHFWKVFFVDRMNGYAQITNYDNNDQYIMITNDGGLTWSKSVYTNGHYEGLGVGFFDTQLGWAGGGDKTYETTDGGASWSQISIDPGYGDVLNRVIRVSPTTLYAVGARVYKYTDLTVGEATIPQVDNTKCKLSCNPNPFQGVATITYTVPEDGHVKLGITSIGGRVIEFLVDKEQKAGTYSLEYTPDYNQKFVACTIRTGRYRRTVKIFRPGGGE